MKRLLTLAGLTLAALPLAGCASDYHHRQYARMYVSSSPNYGWYDGYYGSIYDGRWASGGYYYYRMHDRDSWRRDDGRHFRRDRGRDHGHHRGH
jgi:hypothetical protein